jgi:hypothetical protein
LKNLKLGKKNKIYVYVSVEQWNEPRILKVRLETKDVLELLKRKKIKVGNVYNLQQLKIGEHTRKATWIFEKKSVDKPKKQVTLKEEKPKTTRRRRTKKASTEE